MQLGVMQPYLFPYIGYYQLVYATDIFVFYDDVHFINRGWINRNRILINGKDQLFTIPCKDASQNKLIKDIEFINDPKAMQKLLATMQMAYKKAPYFNDVYPVIEETFLGRNTTSLAELAIASIVNTCDYLGLKRTFKTSSKEYNNQELKKADRLIDICHIEGITNYINPAGGQEIYTKEYYKAKGIDLSFLILDDIEYTQFKNTFIPCLSIIDVMMFNDKNNVIELLKRYTLI